MRIYCLTRIILRENSFQNFIEPFPYEDDEGHNIFLDTDESMALRNINIYGTCSNFNLTEICIGFTEISNRKKYVMNIYRDDIGLLVIPLMRSMVNCKEISKNIIEIFIPLRKFYGDMTDWDLEITVRCIKNTSTKGIISQEEENLYKKYATKINEYKFEDRDVAFEKHPFHLPNQSDDNVLRTKLSDFRTLIHLLCDPETGSYKNVPKNKRYNQRDKCLLMRNNKWDVKAPRKGILTKKSKDYNFCKDLLWTDVDLNDITIKDINSAIVETLTLKRVKLYNLSTKLHPCLTDLFYPNLTILSLTFCNITKVSDDYSNLFLPTLVILDLSNNNISIITKEISKAENLKTFILSNNINLDENGIPWEYLPSDIINLQLRETNISVIPESIKRLQCLQVLIIYSKNLKYIPWKTISTTIMFLDIKGSDYEINEIDLKDKCNLLHLNVINAKLQEIDCSKLPSSLEMLNLSYNKLKYFDTQKSLPFLKQLSVSNNILELICWKNMPKFLQYFYFNNNFIKVLGDISHITSLEEFVGTSNQIEFISEDIWRLSALRKIDLEDNCIFELPSNINNLNSLKKLNLMKNKFNFTESNLEEVLWKRLPKNLETLWIGKNDLYLIPCLLKDVNIQNLHVNDCKLNHICPFLSANSNRKNLLFLNINNNPEISNLPFIPQIIYQPPAYNEKMVDKVLEKTHFTLLKNLPQDLNSLKKFIITSKFSTESKKPIYNFKAYKGKNQSIKCNCCANCGQTTSNNLIEQLMVMDFPLKFEYFQSMSKIKNSLNSTKKQRVEESNKEDNVCNSTDDLTEDDTEMDEQIKEDKIEKSKFKYYPPGKWKTNVVTRLCESCIKVIKEKTDKAFEDFIKLSEENIEGQPNMVHFPPILPGNNIPQSENTIPNNNYFLQSTHVDEYSSEQYYYSQRNYDNQNLGIQAFNTFQPMTTEYYQNNEFTTNNYQQNFYFDSQNVSNFPCSSSSNIHNAQDYNNLPNDSSFVPFTDSLYYIHPHEYNFDIHANENYSSTNFDDLSISAMDQTNENQNATEQNNVEDNEWFFEFMSLE